MKYSVQCTDTLDNNTRWFDVAGETAATAAEAAKKAASDLGMFVGAVRVYPPGTGTSLKEPLFEL